jgi:hypothetical protein
MYFTSCNFLQHPTSILFVQTLNLLSVDADTVYSIYKSDTTTRFQNYKQHSTGSGTSSVITTNIIMAGNGTWPATMVYSPTASSPQKTSIKDTVIGLHLDEYKFQVVPTTVLGFELIFFHETAGKI